MMIQNGWFMSSEKKKLIDEIFLGIFEHRNSDYYSSDVDTASLEELSTMALNNMSIDQLKKFLERFN